jgi:hypothetical protein
LRKEAEFNNVISAPSICDVTRDFKDSNGKYSKSVCTIFQDKTYDDSVATCNANGMKILNTTTPEIENAMVAYSNIQWPYGLFWVEGKTGSNCNVFSNDKKLSYFKTTAACSSDAYFHCEYQSKSSF